MRQTTGVTVLDEGDDRLVVRILYRTPRDTLLTVRLLLGLDRVCDEELYTHVHTHVYTYS